MLRCCVIERLTLQLYLDVGLSNWLKSLVLTAKYPYGVSLQENGSLDEFIDFLVADCVCYSFVTVRGVVYGEDYGLELFWET